MHDGEAVLEVREAHFVDVIGRAGGFQLDRLGIAVRDGQFLGGLLEREVVREEQRGGAEPVAAMVPGDGQQGDVLREFLVGQPDGGVQRPLGADEDGIAEQADELDGTGCLIRTGDAFTRGGGQRAVVEPQPAGPRELDDVDRTGLKCHGSTLPTGVAAPAPGSAEEDGGLVVAVLRDRLEVAERSVEAHVDDVGAVEGHHGAPALFDH